MSAKIFEVLDQVVDGSHHADDLLVVQTNSEETKKVAIKEARHVVLTDLSAGAGGTLTAADSILGALGKLEFRVALNDAKVTGSDRVLKVGDTITGQLDFSGTDHSGIRLLNISEADRDLLTKTKGMLVYNTDSDVAEFWDGSSWIVSGTVDTSKVLKTGDVMSGRLQLPGGNDANLPLSFGGTTTGIWGVNGVGILFTVGGLRQIQLTTLELQLNTHTLSFGPSTSAADTFIMRAGAQGVFGLGGDGSVPFPQTVRSGGGRDGVDTDITGADLTIQSGPGTGSGNGGDIRLQVSNAGVGGWDIRTPLTVIQIQGSASGNKLGFFGATPVVQSENWSVTNVTPTKSFDADSVSHDELSDVVGTVIDALKDLGFLSA